MSVDASDLVAAMARLVADLELDDAHARSAKRARDELARLAPVRSGRLRSSAVGEVRTDGATAFLDTPYAGYVDARRRLDEHAAAAVTPDVVRFYVESVDEAADRASRG